MTPKIFDKKRESKDMFIGNSMRHTLVEHIKVVPFTILTAMIEQLKPSARPLNSFFFLKMLVLGVLFNFRKVPKT